MSHEARMWAAKCSPYRHSTFAIHRHLADVANEPHGNELFMSVRSIAAATRLSDRTVQRALRRFVSDGYLEVLEERPGGTTRYRFLMPTNPRQPVTPDNLSPLTPRPGRGDIRAASTPDNLSPKQKEGSNRTRTEHTPLPPSRGEVRDGIDVDAAFEHWWARYPKKVDKQRARRRFEAALQRATLNELTAGLERAVVYWRAIDLAPAKYPRAASWLRNGEWTSEWTVPPRSGSAGAIDRFRERHASGAANPFDFFARRIRNGQAELEAELRASPTSVIDVPSVVTNGRETA
jgi:DNA-binding transcriptional ArsR family regulator